MPLCRAVKVFKRWNSVHPSEVVTLYFGPENYGQGGDSPALDSYDWENYMKFVTRYISNQLPSQLNTHRLDRNEWPYIETMKPIFVFLNDRDLDNTKTRIFRENRWLHRQSSYMTSTHMSRGVTGTCEHVIIDSGVQCRLKPMYELLTLAVYGTYGLCTVDRARYCNQYLLESSDQCLKYRSEFGRTINFITTDHTTNKNRFPETGVSTAFHINLYNLLQFSPETCKAVSPDAALRWTGDQRIYFFKNQKIHRYEETAQTVDHVFDMKIEGLDKIDAALTQNDTTLIFRGCDLWEYKVTYDQDVKKDTYTNYFQQNSGEPKWKLSKVMKIEDKYPGLPCDLDAAISMYGRQYFFKGCLYYEVTTDFNKKKSKETQWNQGHEGGFKKKPTYDKEHTNLPFEDRAGNKIFEDVAAAKPHRNAWSTVFNDKEHTDYQNMYTIQPNFTKKISPKFKYNHYFVSRPQDIYDWGLPCDIDATLAWNNWTAYFFKDGYYFRWHENKLSEARSLMHWNIDMVECK